MKKKRRKKEAALQQEAETWRTAKPTPPVNMCSAGAMSTGPSENYEEN